MDDMMLTNVFGFNLYDIAVFCTYTILFNPPMLSSSFSFFLPHYVMWMWKHHAFCISEIDQS